MAGAGCCSRLAGLTRELALIFPAACTLALLFNDRKLWGAAWGILVLLPFAAWQIFLRFWLGSWGLGSGGALSSSFELIPYHGWWGYHTPETMIFVFFSIFRAGCCIDPGYGGNHHRSKESVSAQMGCRGVDIAA